MLRFYFWQKVYYLREDYDYPSESKEAVGHIVGISEHVGNALTWKVLTEHQKVIYRSRLRPYHPEDRNLRAAMLNGEEDLLSAPPSKFVKSRREDLEQEIEQTDTTSPIDRSPDDTEEDNKPLFDPEDLVGRSFLLPPILVGEH